MELAFQLGETELDIPSLLDAGDLVSSPSPDRLSLLTYLSQFYHAFRHKDKQVITSSSTSSINTHSYGSREGLKVQ